MTKTIHRDEYQALLDLLRQRRIAAGLTQVQCSEALGRSQSFVSDVERGVRRLDVIQLRDLCLILHSSLGDFVLELESIIARSKGDLDLSSKTFPLTKE